MPQASQPTSDHDRSPHDSVDALLASWAQRRPDLDFEPVAVISRLARLRSHIDAELESVFHQFGLSQADFEAMVTLARISDEHGVSQRRLADELGLTSGTISVRIDRLARQGLVERIPDPDAKRNALVALTPAGKQLFERVAPAHLANEQRLLASLSHEERQLLAKLLRKLLVAFEGSQPTRPDSRLGLVLAPAHVTISMRAAVGLSRIAGLLVRSVKPDTPAARADLQPGDILTHAGDRELRSIVSLYAALRDTDAHSIQLTFLRGNDELHTNLVLDSDRTVHGHTATAREPQRRADHVL